ncbi:Putative PqqC-like protein [Candidatus Trichorickettsia mobilis]|uniref:PqqC-like protein n=1 Tax=Candidatus Trichorickettsia mobilis TaxID=1346319 RepID=A0ABZ0UU50_9RICK|nr:CADD family putative folate metabolism protein [Candidatus Trichorickettsia mobilis]WPY00157.1 Putative PqqC-like protein [Candidatus Trichorickettsia mobilis]
MNFITKLNDELEQYNLLNHDFYKSWSAGCLSSETLQLYAQEYYKHVAAFPRYVSAIHSSCEHLPHRQILLKNLIEEEQGEDNHPELWARFAEKLGCNRLDMQNEPTLNETKLLVDGYFKLVYKDFASGLGALYAYERQTPGVAKSKIEGLQKFYHVNDERSLKFFTVHLEADEWHSAECAKIIEELDNTQQQLVVDGAINGAKLLWQFLDGMTRSIASAH